MARIEFGADLFLCFFVAIKPAKSWLGGWFKRDISPASSPGPGPVKANLGEQTSFVYDPDLKRWVNKKVQYRLSQVFLIFLLIEFTSRSEIRALLI